MGICCASASIWNKLSDFILHIKAEMPTFAVKGGHHLLLKNYQRL